MDSTPPASDPEAILRAEIDRYIQMGYVVTSQTTRSAQLVKPKKFNIMWAIVWFTLAIVPLLVYLLYYAFKWDHRVTWPSTKRATSPESAAWRANNMRPQIPRSGELPDLHQRWVTPRDRKCPEHGRNCEHC